MKATVVLLLFITLHKIKLHEALDGGFVSHFPTLFYKKYPQSLYMLNKMWK